LHAGTVLPETEQACFAGFSYVNTAHVLFASDESQSVTALPFAPLTSVSAGATVKAEVYPLSQPMVTDSPAQQLAVSAAIGVPARQPSDRPSLVESDYSSISGSFSRVSTETEI
jgi:hypothetical protein